MTLLLRARNIFYAKKMPLFVWVGRKTSFSFFFSKDNLSTSFDGANDSRGSIKNSKSYRERKFNDRGVVSGPN